MPSLKRLLTIILTLAYSISFSQTVTNSRETYNRDRQLRKIDSLNLRSRDLSFVDPLDAAKSATQALTFSTEVNYKQGLAYAYRNLASVHTSEGNFFLSMEYLQRALEIFSNDKDSIGIGNCYISMGHLYRRINSPEKELYYHHESYRIFVKQNIKERIAVTAHNLGESYINNGDLTRGERLTRIAIFLNDSLENKAVLSSCYKVMGRIYFEKGEFTIASDFFQKVLLLSQELGKNSQKLATAESMTYLAQIAEASGKMDEYTKGLERAVLFSQQNRIHQQLDLLYTKLISYYSSKEDLANAQHYLKGYKEFLQERNLESTENTIELLNTVVAVHKLERQRETLQSEFNLQQQRIQLRNAFLVIVALAAVVGFWLALRLFQANKRIKANSLIRKNQADIIEKQMLELEKLNNTKDKFFSIVAHDIKTPLNSLKAFASLLADHLDRMTTQEISGISSQLRNSVENTIKMADDLILWAKIQMGTIEVEKSNFEAQGVVNEVAELYQNIAAQKGIKLLCSVAAGMNFFANRDQVMFIIRNLVNNAIKYTRSGGSIEIRAKYTKSQNVQVTIVDSGIGMSLETQEKLFKLGKVRSVAGTDGEKGTGLGLILSYEFAKLNNLEITFSSKEGVGTEFTVTSLNPNVTG